MNKFLILILCIVLQNAHGSSRAAAADEAREARQGLLPVAPGAADEMPAEWRRSKAESAAAAPAAALPVGAAYAPPAAGAGVLAAAVGVVADPEAAVAAGIAMVGQAQQQNNAGQALIAQGEEGRTQVMYDNAMAGRDGGVFHTPATVSLLKDACARGHGLAANELGLHFVREADTALRASNETNCCLKGLACAWRSHWFCCRSRCCSRVLPWVADYKQALTYYELASIRLGREVITATQLSDRIQSATQKYKDLRYRGRCFSAWIWIGDVALVALGLGLYELSPHFKGEE